MKFKVIRAHDGIAEGTIKELAASAVTAYMVENGYWEEVKDEAGDGPKPKPRRKTTKK